MHLGLVVHLVVSTKFCLMKLLLNATVLAALMLTCLGCQTPQHANDNQLRPQSLRLQASAEVEVAPDMATFIVQLACEKGSAASAKTCLVTESNDLISFLEASGITARDIQTQSVDLQRRYTWSNNRQVFQGYTASTMLHLKVRNLNLLDTLYTELLDNRQLQIYGLNYEHSRQDSLQQLAHIAALDKTNAMASAFLQKIGLSELEVVAISNVRPTAPRIGEERVQRTSVEAVEQAVAPTIAMRNGLIAVGAMVYVDYELR